MTYKTPQSLKIILLMIVVSIFMISLSSASLLDGLVNYFSLDESGGTNVYNAGNGTNNGTSLGITWDSMKINNGAYFGGINSSIITQGQYTTAYLAFNNFTVCHWLNVSKVDVTSRYIWGLGISGVNSSIYGLGIGTDGILYMGQIAWNTTIKPAINTTNYFCYSAVSTSSGQYNYTWYWNGVRNGTALFGPDLGTTSNKLTLGSRSDGVNPLFKGALDEFGMWNRTLNSTEISQLYNGGNGLAYPFGAVGTVQTTLVTPENNSKYNVSLVSFNCSASQTGNQLSNISLWTNISGTFTQTQTNVVSGFSASTIFNINVPDGNYLWTCKVSDNSSNTAFASENRTVRVDTVKPTINIISPQGTLDFAFSGQNITLNYTISDNNQGNCWFIYNSVTYPTSCVANNTFLVVDGQTSLTLYANDSFGNTNSASTSWNYALYQGSNVYNTTVYETTNTMFFINWTSQINYIGSTATLNYNGTNYYGTSNCISGVCSARISIDVPLSNSNSAINKSFYWNLKMFNGTSSFSFTSQVLNQTVLPINLFNCYQAATNTTLNFTNYDEQNLTRLKPFRFDSSFNYWLGTGTVYKTLNITNQSATEINLCSNPLVNYKSDAIIAYSPLDNVNYGIRNYFFQNRTIGTSLENIWLLSLLNSQSTSFIIQVQDQNLLPYTNALVSVRRYYPGIDQNLTVFVVRTDTNGQTVGRFETEVPLYDFTISRQGTQVLYVPFQKVFPRTTPYTLSFQVGLTFQSPWQQLENNINNSGNIFYNKTSNLLTFTYSDSLPTFSYSYLEVYKLNVSGRDVLVCSDNSTLSSGIISCVITAGGSYRANGYLVETDKVLYSSYNFEVETFSNTVGLYGAFIAFFIILIAIFMFNYSEIASIWIIEAVLIFLNYIGLIKLGIGFITAIIAIGLIITVIIKR